MLQRRLLKKAVGGNEADGKEAVAEQLRQDTLLERVNMAKRSAGGIDSTIKFEKIGDHLPDEFGIWT